MSQALAANLRVRENFADLLRRQASEALTLANDARQDPDLLEAVRQMVLAIRETARTLRLDHVERAASRVIRELSGSGANAALEQLLDLCRGLEGVIPVLRPIVVVSTRDNEADLKAQIEWMASAIRIVPDLAGARTLAREEGLGALVLPAQVLHQMLGEEYRFADTPVVAYGEDDDIPNRLMAVQVGAAGYLPNPLRLHDAVRRVRARTGPENSLPWRVLVVDRTEPAAQALAAIFASDEIHVIPVRGGFRLLPSMDEHLPDLVVMALKLDGVRATELAAVLRMHHRHADVPRIFIAEDGDDLPRIADAQGVYHRGGGTLAARVINLLDRSRRERGLREYDDVTGAMSRGAILRLADREIDRAKRTNTPLACIRAEVDNIDDVRRARGPVVAEEATRTLARMLREELREFDGIGQLGPAGFVALLPNCTRVDAQVRVDGARQRWESIAGADMRLNRVTCSFSLADSRDGLGDLLLRADRLLVRAKTTGKGQTISG